MARIQWRVVRLPKNRGYAGEVSFPDNLGHQHTVRSEASSKVKAIGKAAGLANKLVNDPTVLSLLPPGAAPALKAVASIAKSKLARGGLKALRSLW
jgi:hypothetical protein